MLQSFICSLYTVGNNNDKKLKKKSYLPAYLIFVEHVTAGAVPRRIFILLTQYGRPKNEPNFLKVSPISFNFNQFYIYNCLFFLPNYFITLLSCLASKSIAFIGLSDGVRSKVPVPVHIPVYTKKKIWVRTELLPPTYFFLT